MTQKKYDVLVYIGRFQMLHSAHVETLKRAAQLAKRVIVIVGSVDRPRTYKNPFNFAERQALLIGAIKERRLSETYDASFTILGNIDTAYDDNAWISRIQQLVGKYSYTGDRIGVIGHIKDSSSDYLRWFPQWEQENVELLEPLDASTIRDIYFRRNVNLKFIEGVVPTSSMPFLSGFLNSKEYDQLIREREYITAYKKQFEGLAYPPVFVTVDAVVVQSGHVLMIERKSEPGKGLMALPGGFFNAGTDASIESACIRELREETGLKVPDKVLKGSIVATKVFDHIDRSARGRTITHAHFIKLTDSIDLPKVKGMDDAAKAEWVPISQIKSADLFEDHYDIIQSFIRV